VNTVVLADGPAVLTDETIPQQLIIPAIDLDSPIVPVGLGTTVVDGQTYEMWQTAENDIGWHQGSGPPGHIGNTILAGHSNGGREIFRRLEDIENGHEILLVTQSNIHHYQVTDKLILREQGEPIEVRAANARWILRTEDERLTLITRWPYPSSTHRLLVIAHPTTTEPLPEPHLQPASEPQPVMPQPVPTTHSDPIFTPQTGQAHQSIPDIQPELQSQQPTSSAATLRSRTFALDLLRAHRLNDTKG